jgi:TRAP-type C4-dicarboxylate transport system permease small subunit
LKKIERAIRAFIEGCGMASTLVLIALMMMTVFDVILRYFFRHPIIGGTEISSSMMVCIVFLGIAWCALKGEHITVDIIAGRLSRRAQNILSSIDNLVTLALGLLIATQSFSQAMFAREMELKSLMLGIPRYPFLIVAAFGFLLLSVAMIILQYNIKKVSGSNLSFSAASEEDNYS